ncbi:hypothetical protein GCM10011351_20750 [Paraliobacillus quinghaiensis]|uniref:Uncharacterized protein n=1 Tax=Paraliobacillus quinghaiensis TaxID=470815 RepID=A0A917TRE8_9BACI|nr:hypothetical protein [Paraliobacillus quinghaiensis]GGM34604.1 hypothetical protein GCM10011351_20750 [Paraliobacillus quinghaiensis]
MRTYSWIGLQTNDYEDKKKIRDYIYFLLKWMIIPPLYIIMTFPYVPLVLIYDSFRRKENRLNIEGFKIKRPQETAAARVVAKGKNMTAEKLKDGRMNIAEAVFSTHNFEGMEMRVDEACAVLHRCYTQDGLESAYLALVAPFKDEKPSLYIIASTADIVQTHGDIILKDDYFNGYRIHIEINENDQRYTSHVERALKAAFLEEQTYYYHTGSYQGYKTERIPKSSIQRIRLFHQYDPVYSMYDQLVHGKKPEHTTPPLATQWRYETEKYVTIKTYILKMIDENRIPRPLFEEVGERFHRMHALDDDLALMFFNEDELFFYMLRYAEYLYPNPFPVEPRELLVDVYVKAYLTDNAIYTKEEMIEKLKEDGYGLETMFGEWIN